MTHVPTEPLYTKTHEWVHVEDRIATIGITDYAQSELGDITFVELPDDDLEVNAHDELATIESVKASSPIYAPVSGTVVEVNTELKDDPGAVNSDPYGAGWICKIEMSDLDELEDLMDAEEYEAYLEEVEHDR